MTVAAIKTAVIVGNSDDMCLRVRCLERGEREGEREGVGTMKMTEDGEKRERERQGDTIASLVNQTIIFPFIPIQSFNNFNIIPSRYHSHIRMRDQTVMIQIRSL